MEQHREEEQQRGEEANGPEPGLLGLGGELLAVLLLEGHCGQGQDQKPAGVNA